jgi:hypothetical protein
MERSRHPAPVMDHLCFLCTEALILDDFRAGVTLRQENGLRDLSLDFSGVPFES